MSTARPARPWTLLALMCALAAACSEAPVPQFNDDAAVDATLPDVTPDAAPDVAAPDVAAPDVATPDVVETGVDAPPDGVEAGMDAAPDAAPDAGSLEVPLPSSTVMTSVTRLGQRGFVIASIDNTDPATPAGDRLSLRYVERVGHRLVTGEPFGVDVATIDPESDNPILLMGSLGPEHFFVVLNLPDYRASLRLFARRAGAFVDLGATALIAGATFPQNPAFFSGHPVDDTRHLLGYRHSDSGQPYLYRLIIRSGDTIRFGPVAIRPSAFPGLSASESQSDPALLRVGPTTFVEARPGYVYTPGNLATWVLEVRADHTLAAGAPVTHRTVAQTMTPEVAADGRGNALVAYQTYTARDWQYATYAQVGRDLTEHGTLGVSGSASIRAHQGESTDRALGGAWFLRLPGGSRAPVPLYRIDAATRAVTTVAEVPSMWACYRVPQMVRVGTIAAYTGCDRVVFVDLAPRCGDGTMDPGERCDDGDNLDGDGCSAGCTAE